MADPFLSDHPDIPGFYWKKWGNLLNSHSNTERCQSWLNVPDSKSGVLERVPGVRIPLSPQLGINRH